MSINLSIQKHYDADNNAWRVVPKGDLDIFSSNVFRDELLAAWSDEKSDIYIDGTDLQYIDSTGLGAIISLYNKMKQDGNEIYLENLKPNIQKLFLITDLDEVFHIVDGEKA